MTTITFPYTPSDKHTLPFATELTLPIDLEAFDLLNVSKLHNDLLYFLHTEKPELLKQLHNREYWFLVFLVGDKIHVRWTYRFEGELHYMLGVSFHHLYARFNIGVVEAAIKQRLSAEKREVGTLFDRATDTRTFIMTTSGLPIKLCKRIRGHFYREDDAEMGAGIACGVVETLDPQNDKLD